LTQGIFIILKVLVGSHCVLNNLQSHPSHDQNTEENGFMSTILLATVAASPSNWSIQVGIIMLLTNLFAFFIGRYAIQHKGVGPSLPAEMPDVLKGFGVPELLAVTSFGHILGAGMILGLRTTGAF
jgi:photosystem I subunit X